MNIELKRDIKRLCDLIINSSEYSGKAVETAMLIGHHTDILNPADTDIEFKNILDETPNKSVDKILIYSPNLKSSIADSEFRIVDSRFLYKFRDAVAWAELKPPKDL